MNVIRFEKGKIIFQVLLIVLFRWETIICQFNLYHIDQTFKSNSLQFDCLNYHVYRETEFAYQGLPNVVDELIAYCRRPVNNFDESFEGFVHPLSQKLSFEQLRVINITTEQLLSWSIPIEVVERYQFYLNQPNSSLNEHIYNCTAPRFGLQCQYAFEIGAGTTFDQIVKAAFRERIAYFSSSAIIVQMSCYVLLKCHRDGQPWCIDWREVCDGKVDCFDEGLDEESCFNMETNECTEDEYRCHNGLCISRELWEGGVGDTDCLDRSDTPIDLFDTDSCFQDPTFRCEEHSCRTDMNSFSCGDGQCVLRFDECHSGRHVSLVESMTAQGNLTDQCWIAMICLLGLVKKVNESLCEVWLMNNTTYAALKQCDPFFQFPTIPVYSHHVRFFYKDPHLRSNEDNFLLPDYVCYNEHLCDFNITRSVPQNLTCIEIPELSLLSDPTRSLWAQLMSWTEGYFRSCSISYVIFHNKTKYSDYPSLYNCQNSSKFISQYRIMDGMQDCFNNDDENYENSCQLNDKYRIKCLNATKCWSSIVAKEACFLNGLDSAEEIPFQSYCDGIDNYFYDNNGQERSDELECGDWLCNNMYTRYDGFWACSDGKDEDGCSRKICPSQTYACISPVNYTVSCLGQDYVNDGTVDCLGALDEQLACRRSYPSKEISRSFRCSNNYQCLYVSQLCNKKVDCPGDDDDEKFCQNQTFTCDQSSAHKRSDVEEVLCALDEVQNRRIKYFSVQSSSNYPSLEKSLAAEFNYRPAERRSIKNDNVSQFENNVWSWYCNRGLVVHIGIKNNSSNRTCICPPSYYGHLCQYQNQRISLTLQLSSNERHATYAVVSMLMDDNNERQEIDAYDQFVYVVQQSCSIKLNRYLLFSTRPKNVSKNYSVRIDIFEKNAITYVGSWHFPITFLFLPVNRLSISLHLSNHRLQRSLSCAITCKNGECVKYVNKDKYFCRCFHDWSGIQCNIPMNCPSCSSNSLCIGSVNNRSICICPIDKFGPRCLLRSICPINACQNNGQCVPADVSILGNNYTCVCSDRFFGENCEHRKAKVDVSLDEIYIPSYIVAYFFTLSNTSEPIETTILRKLTLFQRTVTFHVAVPFQLVFIEASEKYYLAVLQQSPKTDISTSISSRQECVPMKQLNSTILKMFSYERIVYFHLLCRTQSNLTCFFDETYLCLCTNDQHANCMKFNHERNFQCSLNNYCENEGQCLQDHPTCPSTKICLCRSCFFGNQCQFYAKGLGSTLDEILGYEIKRNRLLSEQPITVKTGAAITMLVFLIGIINSILSIITFSRKKSQEIGCGIYLLASSVTSLFTMILFTIKFWFLFFSYQDFDGQQRIFKGNCFFVEPSLKVFLYLDNWLNACVAIEQTLTVIQGNSFNKQRSRTIAIWITMLLFMIISCLFIPQLIHLYIFDDEIEERSWCVIRSVRWLQIYSSVMIFFHYFAPLTINILSVISIIIITARQPALIQADRSFCIHLILKIRKHKHILISSAIIICLTLPNLIISIILDCQKSSHLLWFYLSGYFLSFFPAAFVFIRFVLPSRFYRREFHQFILYIRRRFEIFKLNTLKL